MKKIGLLAILLWPALVLAQPHQVDASSEIDEVYLFLQGAQITRKASTPLKQGISRVVFSGITQYLDPASIRVAVGNQVVILSVSGNTTIQTNPKKAPIIKMLEDSLNVIKYRLDQELNTRFVLEQQESLILVNKELKGDKGLVLIDLEDALLIYQKQLAQIKQAQLDSRRNEANLRARIQVMQAQLAEFQKSNQEPSYEVIVMVSASRALAKEEFVVSYFVQGASWQPNYDLRVKDLRSPVTLHYKADIYNNSGENWDDVKLKLSSGNPNNGGNPPVLLPSHLSFYVPPREVRKAGATPNMEVEGYSVRADGNYKYENNAETVQNTTSFYFDVPARIRVVSNNQPQNIELQQHDLTGNYQHFTVPKLEEEAYLTSRISGWENLNLLAGSANIYFEGAFLGRTDINPVLTADTMMVSLGKDKGVVVKRKMLSEYSSSSFVGSKKRQTFAYEITVRNTKQEAVSIQIEDQLPLSSNKDIVVTAIEISNAQYDETTGKLVWLKEIPSNSSITIRIEYEVKSPKDKTVVGF